MKPWQDLDLDWQSIACRSDRLLETEGEITAQNLCKECATAAANQFCDEVRGRTVEVVVGSGVVTGTLERISLARVYDTPRGFVPSFVAVVSSNFLMMKSPVTFYVRNEHFEVIE